MTEITRAISIARRRILVDRVLRYVGQALVLALPLAIALLLIDRWTALAVPIAAYALIVLGASASGLWMALWRVPRAIDVCIEIDRRLQLKDRIGTAHAIATTRLALPDFAPLVVAEAQQLAATLDLRRAIPIRVSAHWVAAGALALALALSAWLLPARTPPQAPDGGPGAMASAPAQVLAAREAIEKTTSDIRASLDEDEATEDDPNSASEGNAGALEEKIAALDRMAQQLTEQDPANPETAKARSDASSSMDELAQEMASRSERELESLRELARRFEGLEPPDSRSGPQALDPQLREFLDAMSQGEFERAAEALDEATSAAQSLDEQSKRDAAQQLRQMSEQIEKLAQEQSAEQQVGEADAPPAGDEQPSPQAQPASDEPTPSKAREKSLRRALEDLGKSPEEIDEMLDHSQQDSTQRETESELRESGADEELAEKLARDIEQVRRQRETKERADEKTRDVSEALRRTADSIEKPEQQPSPDQQTADEQRQGDEQQSGEQRQGDEQQGEEQQSQREQQSPEAEQRESAKQQSPKPKPGEAGEKQQAEQREGQPQRAERREGQPQQQPQPQPGSEQKPGEPTPSGEQPSPGEQQTPGDEQMPGSQQPGPSPDAPTMLRELERMREAAERHGELSERVKERARELADTMSPEERRALERWAEAQQREEPPPPRRDESAQPDAKEEQDGGGHGTRQPGMPDGRAPGEAPGEMTTGDPRRLETDPVSADLARDDELDGQKIGELPGDGELLSDPESRASAARRNIEAQRAAQRAIEQGEVPVRYHRFIQRYFRQFNPN